MNNRKEFRSLEEQIEILKNRQLNIENEDFAKQILMKENYYSLINGYKDPFIKDKKDNKDEDEFITNAKFEEIYSLFEFDRKLRSMILSEILKYESSLKTKIAYYFTEKHSEANAYFDVNNYNKNIDIHQIIQTISYLSSTIKRYSTKRYSGMKNNKTDRDQHAINYYYHEYKEVPLWVLINFLTFGNIQYLYDILEEDLAREIALEFGNEYNNAYNEDVELNTGIIKEINKMFTIFRNVCAHEERFYNTSLRKGVKTSFLNDYYKSKFDGRRLYTLLGFLRFIINKEDYEILINNLYKEIGILSECLSSISVGKITYQMGLPGNWEKNLLP